MSRVFALVSFVLAAVSATRAGEPLRLVLAGQALIKHDVRESSPQKFAAIRGLLDAGSADAVFTNLEVAIDNGRGQPTRTTQFFHATKPTVVDALKSWGFNLLSLSNNHAFDLGPDGVLGTIDAVRERGFVHAGTGATLAAAAAPAILTTKRGRVALVSFGSGKLGEGAAATATRAGLNEVRLDEKSREIVREDAERVFAALRAAATSAEVVIAYQHDHYWEPDNRVTPAWKRPFAKACIDAGATVFVSHGAPLLHGIELHRGRPIFYDLGGLVFHTITAPGYYLPEVWEGAIARAEFSGGRVTALTLHPIALNERGEGEPPDKRYYETRGVPSPATGAQARAVLERLARLSAAFGTRLSVEGGAARLILP
ncbi:MAG: CapA family protein [Opitutaceae bacterium]|nr:CapA family protein [Opitutaceae bacterium]